MKYIFARHVLSTAGDALSYKFGPSKCSFMNGIANPKVAFKVYTLRNLHDSKLSSSTPNSFIHACFFSFLDIVNQFMWENIDSGNFRATCFGA